MLKTAKLQQQPHELPVRKPGLTWKKVKQMKLLYLLLLLPVVHLFIFHYLPMYGVTIAFKKFRVADGILGSDWNNFAHFKRLFTDMFFTRVFKNTLRISIIKILFGFPAPILFALLMNEIGNKKFKKISQTISYLPHFLSWVIVAGFVYQLLSPEVGAVNYLLTQLGYEPIFFMTKKNLFIPILIFFDLWKGVGWGSIIYLAAISNVDPSLYESAEIDGANRFRRAIHITIPSIIPTITILFILALGGIIRAGFDDIFNLYNPMVMDVADVLETYTFRVGLYEAKYDYAAAVGLFQNVIAITLILITNSIVKKYNEYALW